MRSLANRGVGIGHNQGGIGEKGEFRYLMKKIIAKYQPPFLSFLVDIDSKIFVMLKALDVCFMLLYLPRQGLRILTSGS